MYRRLIWLPVLLCCGLAAAVALRACPACRPLTILPGLVSPSSVVAGRVAQMLLFFTTDLLPLLMVAGLSWAATFHPARRYPLSVLLLKYLAVLAAGGLSLAFLYQRSVAVGVQALALSTQATATAPWLLLAAQAPHALAEWAGLSLILVAPFYWIVRGFQTFSLRRAVFEGWVEARRLAPLAALLVAVAAALSAYAAPHLTAWILR